MSSFAPFAQTISKFQLKKMEEIISDDRVALQLNQIGCALARSSRMATALRSLTNDILKRLPLISQGPQPIIGSDYAKIMQLIPILQQTIESHDPNFNDESQKCAPFLSGALQALQEIQTYIPHLASPSATSMVQYQDALSQKVGFVLQFFDKIVEAVANCENQYSYRLERIQQSEHQISHQIAAAIATLDQLYIELVFLSSNKNIVASPTHSQQLTQWIQVVSGMSQTLFQTPRNSTEGILKALPQIITQFPSLAALIGTIQPLITESDDFAQASNALTTSIQAINEITTKILYKSITQFIKDLVQDYLNEKPLDSLIQLGQDLLAQTRDMIAPLGNNVIGAYSTFATLISICKTDPELTAITLISISRYASFILPDFHKSEELLINITKKIVLITKSIFKEVGKIVSQIISVIDTNLEFFNDTTLNETNFYLSAIKNVEDFEPESNDFILIQQRFFDALAALPIPLNKLVTSCPDVDTKGQLNGLYTQITILSNRFTRWLNQFYLTIFSVIQLRSQSILDVLSFPISILSTLGNQTSLQKHISNSFRYTNYNANYTRNYIR
ncbi:hypothetical protein GPJ56_004495 [Histomonas meleagridis]|uniref:uncharacterized protein n=1 Tax=Histomonas meleagridis TaxID=135588 RepID=UPI003559EF57|nr:hypothetical protein GPJ56_004495 [Histomonas meleagridis]KAH0803595.1 hypothetical protein GO595_003560 [Histomonas meleagridis]